LIIALAQLFLLVFAVLRFAPFWSSVHFNVAFL
jgi:hypothetical protein